MMDFQCLFTQCQNYLVIILGIYTSCSHCNGTEYLGYCSANCYLFSGEDNDSSSDEEMEETEVVNEGDSEAEDVQVATHDTQPYAVNEGDAEVCAAAQGSAHEDIEAIEGPFSELLKLQHPTDPNHILKYPHHNINYDEAVGKICNNIGPCQPGTNSILPVLMPCFVLVAVFFLKIQAATPGKRKG